MKMWKYALRCLERLPLQYLKRLKGKFQHCGLSWSSLQCAMSLIGKKAGMLIYIHHCIIFHILNASHASCLSLSNLKQNHIFQWLSFVLHFTFRYSNMYWKKIIYIFFSIFSTDLIICITRCSKKWTYQTWQLLPR